MKKAIFVLVVFVLFVLVMMVTPAEQLSYNFPLDEGTNKLAAATLALIAALWGAVVNIRKSLLIWGGMVIIMVLLEVLGIGLSLGTIILSLIMCKVISIWANQDEEIKSFILTPFKEDEEK